VAQAQHQHVQEQPAVKSAPAKSSTNPLQAAEGASVKILAPTKGQIFKGDKVEIYYKLTKGKRGHHVHAYVDGELMGMFQSAKGTLNGVKPGKHVLELRVVASDHQTELAARDTVEFTVK
jgi:Cu/Zn superoxide dismutase